MQFIPKELARICIPAQISTESNTYFYLFDNTEMHVREEQDDDLSRIYISIRYIQTHKLYVPFATSSVMIGWARPEKLVKASVSRTPGHTPRTGSFSAMNLNPIFLVNDNIHSFQSHFQNMHAD